MEADQISVVVPVLNESGNIPSLIDELVAASSSAPIGELIFVDDGSTDSTREALEDQQRRCPMLRVICHGERTGQSSALRSGARAARGKLLVTMDGDGQIDPADIVRLHTAWRGNGAAKIAVLGRRRQRLDSVLKRVSSRLANAIRSTALKDGTRDTGCSLRLMRREDYLALPYFNHMHRFFPALLQREGVTLYHIDVNHRPRLWGDSKYGFWNRALVGAIDLVGVAWLARRALPKNYSATELLREHVQ